MLGLQDRRAWQPKHRISGLENLPRRPLKHTFWEMYLAGYSDAHLLSILGDINMKRLGGSNREEMRERTISTREHFVQFPSYLGS